MNGLAESARLAVVWNTGFTLFRDLLQLGVALTLVRLLTPQAYGRFGLASSLIVFLGVFSSQSFVAHTLQVRDDGRVHFDEHFTAGAVIHAALFCLTNAVAFALGAFEDHAESASLVHLMSLSFLLSLPTELRVKMLERDLDWKRLRLLHGLGVLAGSAVAVGMALAGAGVYALIVPSFLKHAVFGYDLFVAARWRPSFGWSRERYAPALRFGAARLGSSVLAAGQKLLETTLFVSLLGFAELGLFGRALGLAQIACQQAALHLMSSIYPVVLKLEPAGASYRRAGGLLLRAVGWTAAPAAVLLATLAEPVVRAAYGERWLEAAPLVPWAAAFAAAGALRHTAYMLLLGGNQQRICLLIDAGSFGLSAAALLWLLPKGAAPYLAGTAAVQTGLLCLELAVLLRERAIEVRALVDALLKPIGGLACSLAVCELLLRPLGVAGAGLGSAAVYAAAFAAVYSASMRFLYPAELAEMVRYFPGGRRLGPFLALEH